VSLTKFVRNVKDVSDDGGYKFRFHCDQCGDGFESQYVAASANLLKTAVDVFSMFRPFGGYGARRVADSIDRGLRGKERDKAYEVAVHKAMHFFKKCNGCGKWVCPQACWNNEFGMCDSCAPNAKEESAKNAARRHAQEAVAHTQKAERVQVKSLACPVCSQNVRGGKFCEHCGASLQQARACKGCGSALEPAAKFCAECGVKTA
jgi:hypothetical protein